MYHSPSRSKIAVNSLCMVAPASTIPSSAGRCLTSNPAMGCRDRWSASNPDAACPANAGGGKECSHRDRDEIGRERRVPVEIVERWQPRPPSHRKQAIAAGEVSDEHSKEPN